MNIEAIEAAWKKERFRPFELLTNDGRVYRVGHPELMWLSPRTQTLILDADDQIHILDTDQINALRLGRPRKGIKPSAA